MGQFAKPMMGCQDEFVATQKYLPLKTYKWNIPTIFLFNQDDFVHKRCEQDESAMEAFQLKEYGRANCVVLYIPMGMKLYR